METSRKFIFFTVLTFVLALPSLAQGPRKTAGERQSRSRELSVEQKYEAQLQELMLKKPNLKEIMVRNYEELEASAGPETKAKLIKLRRKAVAEKLTFAVVATGVIGRPLEELTGLDEPEYSPRERMHQNDFALDLYRIDRRALDVYAREHPNVVIPDDDTGCDTGQSYFSWVDEGKVTPVKDQTACGSCVAFGTMGALEANHLIRNNTEYDAAESHILNCSGGVDCGGGNRPDVLDWAVANGVAEEDDVPYVPAVGACPADIATPIRMLSWGFVDPDNTVPSVETLKDALCEHGPLVVGIRSGIMLQAYGGGLFNVRLAGSSNHAVTLVGWNDDYWEDGTDVGAWLVKNSWGEDWGEEGYFWIEYGASNVGWNAMWVRAQSHLYVVHPRFLNLLAKRLKIITPFPDPVFLDPVDIEPIDPVPIQKYRKR